MSGPHPKIVSLEELQRRRAVARKAGQIVVQCHGCFDIVHPGHLRYLRFAREHGDLLVVSVSGDDVVGKGPERPYINEELRAENLAVLEFVDLVCIDPNSWAGPILEAVRPDVYVKGKEYEHASDPRFTKEKELVEGYGGKVIFSSGDVIYSSTFILSQFGDRFQLEQERVRFFCKRHGVTQAAMEELLLRFQALRVLVVGDPILDRYIHCDALGIASETPMISVSPIREDVYVGAAGLIAAQMSMLGASAGLLTMLGSGSEAGQFAGAIASRNIELLDVRTDERPVFTKTRYLVDERKVFKVDSGGLAPPSTAATAELIQRLTGRLADFDGLLVTDFGYGLFGSEFVEAVCELTRKLGKPYYVDVSHTRRANILKFKRPRLAAPTEEELRFAFADHEAGLSNLASRYYAETGAEKLVMTLGKKGLLLFDPPRQAGDRLHADFLPALGGHAVDTIGAGDVLLAALALSDLAGAPVSHGAYLGSCLAALHVARLGNEPVDSPSLYRYLGERDELSR